MEIDPADTFRLEAADLLDSLEAALLDLCDTPDDRDLIDAAFRALHTIKGSGAMFGFDRVAAFTHDFETAFDMLRKGKIEATQEMVAISLAAKDHIRAIIDDPDAVAADEGEAIVGGLRRCIGASDEAAAADAGSSVVPATKGGAILTIAFDSDIMRNGNDPLVLLDDLRALGSCEIFGSTDNVPALADLDPEACFLNWTVTFGGEIDLAAIDDVFLFVRDEMTLEIRPVTPPAAIRAVAEPPVERAEGQRRGGGDDKGSTVRVQADRLDELMDRVGELVVVQARLSQLAGTGGDLAMKGVAEEIERLASALRDTTKGLRMVPMGTLFGRFRRLIHDLSRDLGKPVQFVTVGEETEMDKTMIEQLADPLVHLIRNAIDHGIEAPGDRIARGKAETGHISLSARHVGAQVQVTVQDDGAGLDTVRIRAKAEEQGLVAPDAVLSDHEIHQFLFHPGFSTAKTVSALSGRGVGMDVVKRAIEAMRGTIELSTVPGQGSAATLCLPLTLAIIEGLLVRIGDGRYIIPLSAVEECIEFSAASDLRARDRNFLNLHGAILPFLRLREVLATGSEPDLHQKIVVTSSGDMRVGLAVDQIIGSHQTVIKSLSLLHSDVTLFSGATILGDGAVALILDIAQLVQLGQAQVDQPAEAA